MRTKFTFLLSTALIMGGHLSVFAGAEQSEPKEGLFLLKNVATNKYLCPGNSYGTQNSLGEVGMMTKFIKTDGGYQISTKPYYHLDLFLANDGYVDAGAGSRVSDWTITPVEGSDKVYTLTCNGKTLYWAGGESTVVKLDTDSPADAQNAQWQLISYNDLNDATENNPVDLTSMIYNNQFEVRDDSNGTLKAIWNSSPTRGGDADNRCAEVFNKNFDVYQTLTDLPNGKYRVSCQAFYRAGNNAVASASRTAGTEKINAVLYANDATSELMSVYEEAGNNGAVGTNVASYGYVPNSMSDASKYFTAGLYKDNSVEVVVVDGTLRLGIKKETTINEDWALFDNFKLEYLGQASSDAALKAAQAEFKTLQGTASDLLNNTAYSIVGGKDKTDLEALVNKSLDEVTVDNIESLKKEINDAMNAFKADVEIYRNFDKHIDVANLFGATALGIEIPSKDLKNTATGEELRTKRNEVYMAIYNYVESNYKKDVTSVLDAGLDAWDKPGFTLTSDNWQSYRGHYSGSERYHEVNGGYNNTSAWTNTLTKNINGLLPGKYVVKVACRTSQNGGNSAGMISAKIGEADAITAQFPLKDDTGHGIATDGSACFVNSKTYNTNNRDGGGWEWKYVPFEVTTPSDVTLSITLSSEGGNNYPGFYDPQILTITQDVALNQEKNYEPTALSANVTIIRPMNQGKWNTIVLPFDVTADQVKSQFGDDAVVASYTGNTGNTLNFKTETEGMQANVPYMVKPTSAAPEAGYKFDDVIMVKANDATSGEGTITFVGNYENGKKLSTSEYFINSSTDKTIFYQASGSETMKAYRATFHGNDATTAKVLNFSLDGSETTGIADVDIANKANSYNVYNLNGMLVKKNATSLEGLAKGVYIVNGKKYIAE